MRANNSFHLLLGDQFLLQIWFPLKSKKIIQKRNNWICTSIEMCAKKVTYRPWCPFACSRTSWGSCIGEDFAWWWRFSRLPLRWVHQPSCWGRFRPEIEKKILWICNTSDCDHENYDKVQISPRNDHDGCSTSKWRSTNSHVRNLWCFLWKIIEKKLCSQSYLFEDEIGVTTTNTLDGGNGEHDVSLTINVGVHNTQNVLKRLRNNQRHLGSPKM